MSLFALGGIMVAVAAACIGLLWLARRSPLNERFASQLGEHGRAFDFLGEALRARAGDLWNWRPRGSGCRRGGGVGGELGERLGNRPRGDQLRAYPEEGLGQETPW
jgi:hypothetical protein